jgi:hypothetical protein
MNSSFDSENKSVRRTLFVKINIFFSENQTFDFWLLLFLASIKWTLAGENLNQIYLNQELKNCRLYQQFSNFSLGLLKF